MKRLLLLAAAACSSGPSADCAKQADEVGAFLTAMDHAPSFVDTHGVTLVERADLPVTEPRLRPVVTVTTAYSYHGQTLALGDLRAKLAADEQKLAAEPARHGHAPDLGILFLIDAAARWSVAKDALAAARDAGFTEVTFLFARPAPVAPPPHTKVDDEWDREIGATPADGKLEAISAFFSKRIAPCPALVEVFGRAAADESGDRTGGIVKSVGPALRACRCAVDPAEMRSLFWRFVGNAHPTTTLTATFAPDGAALAGETWGDVARTLAAKAIAI